MSNQLLETLKQWTAQAAKSPYSCITITLSELRKIIAHEESAGAAGTVPPSAPAEFLPVIRGEEVKFAFIEGFQAARRDTCGEYASEDLIDHFWDESQSRSRLEAAAVARSAPPTPEEPS